jgi:hypothetical protein
MDTALIDGTAVPDFDKNIAAWLQRPRSQPDDDRAVWTIGIRNHDLRVYRQITVHGARQHLDTITFFSESGFSALPIEFVQEPGLDYVFRHEPW